MSPIQFIKNIFFSFYYRKHITLFAFLMACLSLLFANQWIAVPLFIFVYLISVSVLDICVYFGTQKRESQKVSAQDIKKRDKLSLKQLDAFILKMVKMRLITLLLGVIGFSLLGLMGWIFITLYTRSIYLAYQLTRKTLKYPARYGKWRMISKGYQSSHPMTPSAPHPLYTMDNAFYAGTGVITYRKL